MKAQKLMIERHPTPEEWRDHVGRASSSESMYRLLNRSIMCSRWSLIHSFIALGDGIIKQARHRFQKAHPNVVVYTKNSAYHQPRDGTFGYQGNNYFCTQSCGYDWAVRQMKRQDGAAQVLATAKG